MKTFAFLFAVGLLAGRVSNAQPAPEAPPEAPKTKSAEALHYNVNWPSGLSLGDAELTSSRGDSWNFTMKLDVSLPGFALTEEAKSSATQDFCSVELQKLGARGQRKVDERTEFDPGKMKATRSTKGGGKSEMAIPACAKDALTFVHFLRRELASGRLPQQQKVYYGGPYDVRVTFAGTQRISVAGEAAEADKIQAYIKGPKTDLMAELYFSKDGKWTPLLIQVPLAMGKFAVELAR